MRASQVLKEIQQKEPDMVAHRFILGLAVAISGSIMLQSSVSAQENQGTEAQRMACTPDVFRLCGAQIPDHDRIVSCLRQNITLLSRPCRAVFEPNSANSQQGAPQVAPRGRPMQPSYGAQQPYQRYQPYQDDDNDDNE